MRNRRRCPRSSSSDTMLAMVTTILAISASTSFQISNVHSRRPLSTAAPKTSSHIAVGRTVLYSSNGGEGPNDGNSEDSIPFFAQATKEKDVITDTEEKNESPVALVEKNREEEETTTAKIPESKAAAEARNLRAQAEKARLEAEKMDVVLTLEKIGKLEKKLTNVEALKKHPEEEKEIRAQIALLSRKLNGEEVAVTASKKSVEKKAQPKKVEKEEQISEGFSISSSVLKDDSEQDDQTTDIEPISEEELQKRIDGFNAAPKVLREMTAKAAGFDDDSDVKAIATKMYEQDQRILQKQSATKTLPKDGELPIVMDEQEIQNAIDGFEKLPPGIRDMVAKSAGMESGENATAVIYKLNEEKRLFPSQGSADGLEGGFQVETELVDIFEDVMFAEKAAYVRGMLPEVTRKDYQTPSDEDVDLFFRKVCGKKTFNPISKPETVPGGVIIRGENCVGGDNAADDMVAELQAKVLENNLDSKLQFYYILDPTPVTEEQIDMEDYERPVLLITGADISPETKYTTKGIVSALGAAGVASFALGALSFNDGIMDRLMNTADLASEGGLSWLSDLATPLFLASLGIQLAHELAHRVVAFKDKFDVGLPTLVPSLQLGLTGAITPLNSPPKNLKSLFDFAISGPLVGILVSLALMYVGLEKTAFMDAAELSQLPGLPVQLLRSSSLGGGIIEYLLGDGILLAPDPTATVSLHPYAIAGFVGIMTNALSLLPVGNTDGGRIAHTMLGRSLSRVVQGFTLLGLVVVGLFGADESNILLFYSLFVTLWQREPEIPCQNEVDELDLLRGTVAIGAAVLVALALVPIT